MTTDELRDHIEAIIQNTFETIDKVYLTNKENGLGVFCQKESRLVFPKYRNKNEDNKEKKNSIRVSEQELRFLFVEEFNKYIDSYNTENGKTPLELFYSIETPSTDSYIFGDNPKKHCEKKSDGISAQFDLVIFNKSKQRVCLIEFKNNKGDAGEHAKDFLKLSSEGDGKLCYFISIAESSNNGTLGDKDATKGIIPKFKKIKEQNTEIKFGNITYICHCLNKSDGGFKTIYAGIIHEKSKKYEWDCKPEIFKK